VADLADPLLCDAYMHLPAFRLLRFWYSDLKQLLLKAYI